jgi:hypothetical protein
MKPMLGMLHHLMEMLLYEFKKLACFIVSNAEDFFPPAGTAEAVYSGWIHKGHQLPWDSNEFGRQF